MSTTYEMPSDVFAERAIISGMVQDEVVFYRAVESLTADNFYNPNHGKVFDEIKKSGSPDLFVLDKALSKIDGMDIAEFLEAAYTIKGDNEIKSILESYARRKIIEASQKAIRAVLSEPDKAAVDISSEANSALSRISCGSERTTFTISELIPGEIERIETIAKGGSPAFIQTGVDSIDQQLIISKHDYVLLAGRPSNGKSTFASLIARNVCSKGKVVAYFCLDSTKEVEISRAVFTTARASLHAYNTGMVTKSVLPRIKEAINSLSDMKLCYDQTPGITVEQIAAKAFVIKTEQGGLDGIIIDFLQNIAPSTGGSVREQVNHISYTLHNLPRKIGCPVIALSQMSRYEKEESIPPQRGNLKESGNLEADADSIMLVHWPAGYPSYSGDDRTAFRVSIAKHKNGPTGFKILNFNGETGEITSRTRKHEVNDGYDSFRND